MSQEELKKITIMLGHKNITLSYCNEHKSWYQFNCGDCMYTQALKDIGEFLKQMKCDDRAVDIYIKFKEEFPKQGKMPE